MSFCIIILVMLLTAVAQSTPFPAVTRYYFCTLQHSLEHETNAAVRHGRALHVTAQTTQSELISCPK